MRRRRRFIGLIPMLIGIIGIMRFNGDPRLLAPGAAGVTFHGAQVLGLIGSGACLGCGLVLVVLGSLKLRDDK